MAHSDSKIFKIPVIDLNRTHWITGIGPYGVRFVSITITMTGVEVQSRCMKHGTERTLTYDIDETVEVQLYADFEVAKWEGIAQAGVDALARETVVRSSIAAQWVSDMRTLCGCKACRSLGWERTCVVRDLIRANPMSGQLVGPFMVTPSSGLDDNGQSVTSPLPPPLQPGELRMSHEEWKRKRQDDWLRVDAGTMTHEEWRRKWAPTVAELRNIPS